jgi:hypothetical protein
MLTVHFGVASAALASDTTPMPLQSLATAFPPTAHQDAAAIEAIHNASALYPLPSTLRISSPSLASPLKMPSPDF